MPLQKCFSRTRKSIQNIYDQKNYYKMVTGTQNNCISHTGAKLTILTLWVRFVLKKVSDILPFNNEEVHGVEICQS